MKSYQTFVEKYFQDIMSKKMEPVPLEKLMIDIRDEFEDLLPDIPYIGGMRKNRMFTEFLVGSAMIIAIYRKIKDNYEDEEIGKIIFEVYDRYYDDMSSFQMRIMRFLYTSRIGIWYTRRLAENSKKSPYDYDWSFDFVKGEDGVIYGMNYSKCGIKKYFEEQNLGHMVSYVCILDHLIFGKLGVGFKRTKTLGMGSDHCDFQILKKPIYPLGWSPEHWEDYTNWKQLAILD